MVCLQVICDVNFAEFAPVLWQAEIVKFFFGLLAEIASIDKKKHAPCLSVHKKTAYEVARCKCLARARCHLNECAGLA